jgi:hypothetical protein
MALEQIAPKGDAYRAHAEAALEVYTGRSLYAIITFLSKMEQLNLESDLIPAVQALLLHAFDACNSLWGHPEGRARPKQLTVSPQFREFNFWKQLEQLIADWPEGDTPVDVRAWKAGEQPQAGSVLVFPGSVREWVNSFPQLKPELLLTVLPRPNQAFWTLAALWASWLWDREGAAPIKVALRRRRYDWGWHASALRTTMERVSQSLPPGTPLVSFIPEAEPGFLSAALAGLDAAGFRLTGRALRVAERQAMLRWTVDPGERSAISAAERHRLIAHTAKSVLQARGGPARFIVVHMAAWSELAQARQLKGVLERDAIHPLTALGEELVSALRDHRTFQHFSRGADPEHGYYWIVESEGAREHLSDRVELIVLESLRESERVAQAEIYSTIYRSLSGLLSPDRQLVEACLQSYAVQDHEQEYWQLRPEDESQSRLADRQQIQDLLAELGAKLGFKVKENGGIAWVKGKNEVVYRFQVQETAVIGDALSDGDPAMCLVLPGGRAALILEKSRKDPRLREWLRSGVRVIKFRHVRRLAAETTLHPENLGDRLALDPPEHQDSQLPLL